MPWPGLPLGGGKAVMLADADRTKTPEMLAAFGRAVDALGGRYVTAEDVGMSVADMVAIAKQTKFVAGLPVRGRRGRRRSRPAYLLGVFLGIKAAVKRALGKDSLAGLHIAFQGAGSVAGRRCAPRRGRRRQAVDRRRRPGQGAEAGRRDRRHGRSPDDILVARSRRAQPLRARRDPDRADRSPR